MPLRHDAAYIAENDRLRSRYVRALTQDGASGSPPLGRVQIPKVLIQFWHEATAVPADVRECLETWEPLLTRGFTRLLFNDDTARDFIRSNLGDPHVTAFDQCRHPAMRCDYFRLCYIWKRGGFYVDADEVYQGGDCELLYRDNRLKLQPLCYDTRTDTMVRADVFIGRRIYSPAWIFYVNNNPLIAPVSHPVIHAALARATHLLRSEVDARLDIQSTTGPGNLTASLVRHCVATRVGGGARDISLLSNWDSISACRWPLSYRGDERNWRLWRPSA
jgi:hypothetical protein